ncbi:SecDF P1 head subdomain-containing protein [Shewanella eurypsychrophilus]
MKGFGTYVFILIFSIFSFSAFSHDEKKTDDINAENVKVAALSLVWVARVDKSLKSVEESAKNFTPVIEYRGEQYRLLGSEIISNQDILSLEVHSENTVRIELTELGAANLSRETAKNIGEQMATLLDGDIINVATVQMQLGAKMIMTGLTEEQVKYLVSAWDKGARTYLPPSTTELNVHRPLLWAFSDIDTGS